MLPQYEQKLAKILDQLSSHKDDLVVAGGVCVALYHRQKGKKLTESLFTADLDLAVDDPVRKKGKSSLKQELDQLGLESEFSRVVNDSEPKMIFVWPEEEYEEGFELEFLMPLHGEGKETTGDIHEGITAERLRYLDLLLFQPDQITMTLADRDVSFRLPKPALFIVHRALAVDKRSDREKQKKDYAYILDLIDLYSSEFDNIKTVLHRAQENNQKYKSWIPTSLQRIERRFQPNEDPLINAAARLDHLSETRAAVLVEEFITTVSD